MLDFKRQRLITQTVGSGTYVSPDAQLALAELQPALVMRAVSPAELMSARLVLEPAVVEMVIGNATVADFARMDECNAARRSREDAGGIRDLGRSAARGRLPRPRTTISSSASSG